MRIGSLFSGAGGLDLAALELFPDSSMAWHSEVDPAAAKVLEHHWLDVPNLGDVTEIDWATVEPVDALTGGYPCQPFSAAGQRKGTHDERHLWPYVREAIRRVRPRYTLLENVAGHRSLGFDRVLADLAADGLHARWTSLRASDIGAPHHRERLFILVTDSHRGERDRNERAPRRQPLRREAPTGCGAGLPPDTNSVGLGEGQGQPVTGATQVAADLRGVRALPDSADDGRERRGPAWQRWRGPEDGHSGIDWGAYAPAVRRWERLTRSAPDPTTPNGNGRPHLAPRFVEWMMGVPPGWVTDPEIGLTRAEQLRLLGNSVVPPQAVAAFRQLFAAAAFEGAAS